LFDAIRAETSRWGIEVLLVAPGFIRTDISLKALTGDGTPYGIPGSSNETSMPVEVCARQIVAALRRGKREIYPGGMKEKGGVYLSRFAPGLLARLIRRVSVT
jgi:short-subunit dehydrogenase